MAQHPDRETRALLARVDTLAGSWLALRRSHFATNEGGQAIASAAKAGAYNGSAHRQHMHDLCAAELAARRQHLCTVLLDTHKLMSGSPRAVLRSASKDWITRRLTSEASDLEELLPKPQIAFGDTREPDRLTTEAAREINVANASVDNAFDGLVHDRVERVVRWVARQAGALLRLAS